MSDWSDICHTLLQDISEITELAAATQHHCAPWDPQRFNNDGDWHLAVWPSPDGERAEPFTTMGRNFVMTFLVAVWFPAEDDALQVADEEAAELLLDVQNLVRTRFLDRALNTAGGAWQVRYTGANFQDATASSHWFVCGLEAQIARDLT